MKVSTRGRYALAFMFELAKRKNQGYIPLKEIAQKQNISKKYLEQIIPILNKSDFLLASRGAQGGYQLAREPKNYTVRAILEATENSLSCHDTQQKPVNDVLASVWSGLDNVILEYFERITLQDLLDQERKNFVNDFVI